MTKAAEPSYRKRVGYQAALLGGFATVAAAFLAIGDVSTRDAIALRQAEDTRASLSQIIPASLHDNNLLQDRLELQHQGRPMPIYRATQADRVIAVAYPASGKGYSGEISLIMAVAANGEILGVRVLAHAETPGLGDKIEEQKDDWILGFNGLSLSKLPESDWEVKKDGGRFDQFSGATITPRAVVRAVREGLQFFHRHQQPLLATIKQDAKGEPSNEH